MSGTQLNLIKDGHSTSRPRGVSKLCHHPEGFFFIQDVMLVSFVCVQFSALAPVSLKATWWVRLWNARDQLHRGTENHGRTKWKLIQAEEERTLSFHLLTRHPRLCVSVPPGLFSLLSSPVLSTSLCDWSELFWPGFWSQHITSHFVSHNSHLRELAARLCMQPVHRPAAEGIWKQHKLFCSKRDTEQWHNLIFWSKTEWGIGNCDMNAHTYFIHSAVLARTAWF